MKIDPSISMVKAIIASSIGNIVEWYTFLVYVYLTPEISRLFFPNKTNTEATILSLLIFAVGFLARPIGALIFGYMGDKFGRRRTLILSQLLMAITTLFICFLPTYRSIGLYAPILLTLLRVVQGLSIAGEYTTSLCYLAEVAPRGSTGKWVSTVPSSTALGILISSLVVFVFIQLLSHEELLGWGWRACFFVGFIFSMIGVYLRQHLPETSVFIKLKANKKSKKIDLAFKPHTLKLMFAISLLVIAYAFFYQLLFVWMPVAIFTNYYHGNINTLFNNIIALLVFMIAVVYGGILSDQIGRRKLMLITEIIIILSCVPMMYWLFHSTKEIVLLLFIVYFSLVFGLFVGSASTYFSEIYQPEIRASALSLSYNIPYAIFGGLTPVILSTVTLHYTLNVTIYITLLIFIIAFITTWKMPDR